MIVEVWQPGTPSTPGTPARYTEINGPSWSSGAISIPTTDGDGGYMWSIPASVVGVFIGLADLSYPGTGYIGIQHALYFCRGVVDIYERGQKIGTLGSYVSGDNWKMFRQAGRVWIVRNGVKEFDRKTLIAGTFLLASTQYLTGDTVVDAAAVGVSSIPTSGSGLANLQRLRAYGFETAPGNWGVAELLPLTSGGWMTVHGSGTATLSPLDSLGSDRKIAQGRARMKPLAGHAESDLIAPGFATGSSVVGPLSGVSHMTLGGIGVGVVRLRGMLALGSDRPIAQGVAEMAPMIAWGAEATELIGSALTLTGRYRINASGRRSDSSGSMLIGPSLQMAAFGGGQAKLKGPRLAMTAAGTSPNIGRASLSLDGPLLLVASGTTSEYGRASLGLQNSFTLLAYSGGQAKLSIKGAYSVTGNAISTEKGEARVEGPGFFHVAASGHRADINSAMLIGPALVAAPSGHAWLVGPSLTLRASGTEVVAVTYESYAINLKTGAVTHYVDFPFDRVLRFDGRHFGVKSDGVYLLAGDTDNGTPIDAAVKTFPTDFGATNFKRVPFVYLYGRFGGDMAIGTQANEGTEYTFPASAVRGPGVSALRAKIAQGLKGNAWSFTITNADGASFDIDRMEALVTTTVKAY